MEEINNNQQEPIIEELKKQAEENLNGWKRCKADLINLQNDTARERIEWAKFAAAGSLQRLLPAIDTLAAAAAHLPELNDTVRKFEEYLKGEGITEVEAVGIYNPSLHEVISKEKKEGAEADVITTVVQKGYRLHDKLLRPAKVIIAE